MAKKNKSQSKPNSRSRTTEMHPARWSFDALMEPNDTAHALNWPQRLTISLVFISIFFLYVYTLAPEIATGDSGEFVSTAYLLGISHPPGYPLYNLLGKLFAYIPYQSIAWRINLSSAACNTTAGIFIYLALYQITRARCSALLGALFFTTSPIAWEYALKAEVFALNNVFAAWIMYLLMSLRSNYLLYRTAQISDLVYQHKNRQCVYWILLVCGLALTNHHTIVLLAPSVILALWYYGRHALLNLRTVLTGLALFFMGLAVYLYIPIRAYAEPYFSWDDARTWSNFIRLVSRADYGTFTLINVSAQNHTLFEKYYLYIASLLKQFNPLGVLFAVLGIVYLLRLQEKKLKIILFVGIASSGFIFQGLANAPKHMPIFLGVLERFYLLPNLLVALLIGLGAYYLPRLIHTYRTNQSVHHGSLVITSIACLSLIAGLYYHFPTINQRNNVFLYRFGQDVLNTVEANAIILTRGDPNIMVLNYLQQVKHLRPDVIVLSREQLTYDFYLNAMKKRHPTLTFPFIKFNVTDHSLQQFIAANLSKRPIYLLGGPAQDNYTYTDYRLMPMGLVQKVVNKQFWLNKDDYIQQSNAIWQRYQSPTWPSIYPQRAWENDLIKTYAVGHFNRGLEYQQLKLPDLAMQEYSMSIRVIPDEAMLYKNIGIIYIQDKQNITQAMPYFKRYLAYDIRDDDADRKQIQILVNQHEPKLTQDTALEVTQKVLTNRL